jgi:hypothetical protein
MHTPSSQATVEAKGPFSLSALGLIHLFSQKRWMIPKICVTGAKVCNGQHENLSGGLQTHLAGGARALREKRQPAVPKYCLQYGPFAHLMSSKQ